MQNNFISYLKKNALLSSGLVYILQKTICHALHPSSPNVSLMCVNKFYYKMKKIVIPEILCLAFLHTQREIGIKQLAK